MSWIWATSLGLLALIFGKQGVELLELGGKVNLGLLAPLQLGVDFGHQSLEIGGGRVRVGGNPCWRE